jgi:hypothetical protein
LHGACRDAESPATPQRLFVGSIAGIKICADDVFPRTHPHCRHAASYGQRYFSGFRIDPDVTD